MEFTNLFVRYIETSTEADRRELEYTLGEGRTPKMKTREEIINEDVNRLKQAIAIRAKEQLMSEEPERSLGYVYVPMATKDVIDDKIKDLINDLGVALNTALVCVGDELVGERRTYMMIRLAKIVQKSLSSKYAITKHTINMIIRMTTVINDNGEELTWEWKDVEKESIVRTLYHDKAIR